MTAEEHIVARQSLFNRRRAPILPRMTETQITHRRLARVVDAMPTSDGAGVRLYRSLGTHLLPLVDPFLMLDEFRSDRPNDYLAGFPNHPHRGFETVTIMLAGEMEHRDSQGNRGLLTAGSVQWMTAGRGIIHSEMPRQRDGLMWGFQLWVNLAAKDKMTAPRYQDIEPASIPVVELPSGARARVIAGTFQGVVGPVGGVRTDPFILDLDLPAGATVDIPIPAGHQGFVYVYEGEARLEHAPDQSLGTKQLGVLSEVGDRLAIEATSSRLRLLSVTGQPLHEPIARSGPFVMNTRQELEQAFLDAQRGTLA